MLFISIKKCEINHDKQGLNLIPVGARFHHYQMHYFNFLFLTDHQRWATVISTKHYVMNKIDTTNYHNQLYLYFYDLLSSFFTYANYSS
jgi:hypothetical protein